MAIYKVTTNTFLVNCFYRTLMIQLEKDNFTLSCQRLLNLWKWSSRFQMEIIHKAVFKWMCMDVKLKVSVSNIVNFKCEKFSSIEITSVALIQTFIIVNIKTLWYLCNGSSRKKHGENSSRYSQLCQKSFHMTT